MNVSVLTALGINVVTALLIAVAALWLSGFVKRYIEGLADKNENLDITLMRFAGSMARYFVLAIAVIFILARFGIETTSLAALLGAAGLAVGLALQGTLSNVAAGVLLIAFRPFKAGDVVEAAGHTGKVAAVTLFTTELTTPDNVQIIVPNGDIFAGAIKNFSHHDTRRVDFVFGVSYGTNLKDAEDIIVKCIEDDERIHADPAPFVKVGNLGDSSVDFTVRVWCDAADYWDVHFDMTRNVKEAFDAGNIDIPFPTTTMIQG
ncbi:mechanosensitive ion channel MscS [Actibacterium atlanticum]|uniref:Small-conductance mechanosensitive channel n=1 Tax=Actibacterium atlanticum TaxID=1461693 RepID=A0A058ZM03_9RHOB|nr:mechanosensitive ion channel domain-containing protein [Actibacterium atlanticum]KCV82225.1 mechanosensitive ion channel MscS [Actibacterium atlanticum]